MNILVVLYHLFNDNLGWAVVVLAIGMRLLMIPLTKTQTEMTSKMASLKPKLEKIQKEFKHNPEALAKEQMKLYREVGYNPLGCLASFLPQIAILIVIVQVIRVATEGEVTHLYSFVERFVNSGSDKYLLETEFFFWDLAKDYRDIADKSGYFDIRGLAYILLALAVGVTQYVSTKFMQIMQGTPMVTKKANPDEPLSPEEMQAQMMKSMNNIFPIMTAVMSLGTPAVLGLYWFVQSLMFVAQYFFIDREKSIATLKTVLHRN